MLYGRPYLEASEFIEITNRQDEFPGEVVPVNVYFLECVYDDCGWGGGKISAELNSSMEQLTEFFNTKGKLIETVKEPDMRSSYYPIISKHKEKEALRIYNAQLLLKSSVTQFASRPRQWFLYYVGYPDPAKEFDAYTTSSALDSLLNKLAHLIVLLAVMLALIAPIYLFVYFLKSSKAS